REPVRGDAEIDEQRDVVVEPVDEACGDGGGTAVEDAPGHGGEGVPRGGAATYNVTLDLQGRGGDPDGEVARWSLERRPFLAFAATPAPTPVSGVGFSHPHGPSTRSR